MSHDDHSTHHVNYLAIFFVLCGCTALSVIFDVLHMPKPVTIVLVLAVACAKAMCVMMYFMHLKFEGNWKYVLLAPTTILSIGLPLALFPDIGRSYYISVAPQTGVWAPEISDFESHEAEHAEDHPAEPAPAE
ncbi:MAG: cytochrome C oxidase subunit IV family protein [Planctomycetales bacterium]|jgi:cytochrome c oxidase subunit 4|nr:cytochrome C oxidase subunit IV family protein [Planctomycetales bacterium]